MKRTSIFDIYNNEIVEGDRISYSPQYSPIAQTYIDFFNIDSIVFEVLDLKGAIGCEVVASYFSKGIQVANTYQDDLDYFSEYPVNNWNGKRDFIKKLKKKNISLSDLKIVTPISSVRDVYSFKRYFLNPPKEIITRNLHGEARLDALSENPNYSLFFELENGLKMFNHQSYIIELSDKSRDFVIKQAQMSRNIVPVLNDFTHLKAVFKEYDAPFHQFSFIGCNSLGESVCCEYVHNDSNIDDAIKDVEVSASCLFDDLIRSRSPSSNDKYASVQDEKDFYVRRGIDDVCKDKLLMDIVPIESLFVSLTSSFDVFVRLVRDGSTFKEL